MPPSLDHPAPHGLVVTTRRMAVMVSASPEFGLVRAALAVDRPDAFGRAILGNGAHRTPPDAFAEQGRRFAEPDDAPAAVAEIGVGRLS